MEKKYIKISFSTFFLILAIIAIIIMAYYIYVISRNDNEKEQQIAKLNNQVTILQNSITNSHETIDTISNSITSTNAVETSTNQNSTDQNATDNSNALNTLSEVEAKSLITQKYELAIKLYGISSDYFEISSEPYMLSQDDSIYLIKNYDDIVKKYFSDNMLKDFEENATCLIVFEEKHWIAEGGGGFSSYAGIEAIENVTISDDKITCSVKTRHIYPDENSVHYEKSSFTLVKRDNNWLIDEYTFLN